MITQAGNITYYTVANDPASIVEINRTHNLQYQQAGAYAEGAYNFNQYLRAIAGARVDVSTRYDDVPISPRAALIGQALGGRLTLKYIFSMAYVAPAPYFSYNIFDNGTQITTTNLNLEPERARSNEVNIAWQSEYLLLSASGYYNTQSDLLITAQSEAPETVFPIRRCSEPRWDCPPSACPVGESRLQHRAWGSTCFSASAPPWSRAGARIRWSISSAGCGRRSPGCRRISRHNVRFGTTVVLFKRLSITPSLVLRSTPENLTLFYRDAGVSLETPYGISGSAVFTPSTTWTPG